MISLMKQESGMHAPAVAARCTLHNDKRDKANFLHDTNAKIVAKRLPNLDTVSYPKLWKLAWLHCTHSTDALMLYPVFPTSSSHQLTDCNPEHKAWPDIRLLPWAKLTSS